MEKRMLIAGVVLAFAGAAWGQCPSSDVPAPSQVVTEPYGHQQEQFMLIMWDSVEEVTRYTIYWEILVDHQVDPSGEVVELDELRPSFVPLVTVDAVLHSEVQRVVMGTGDAEPTGWGVTADVDVHGEWVSSPMTTVSLIAPQAATAVEAVSWAEVKATAAE